MSDAAQTVKQVPSKFILEELPSASFDVVFSLSTRHRMVHFRSSSGTIPDPVM